MTSFDSPKIENRENRELTTFTLVDANQVRGKDKNIDRILSYVEQKTGSKRFARRSDIRPQDLKDLLPHICFFRPVIGETGELEDVFITLMGTTVASFYGEFTDKGVQSHPNPDVSRRIVATVAQILKDRRPTFAESEVFSADQQHLAVKAVYVPLAEDGENIDRLFVYVRVYGKSLLNAE